MHKFNPKKAEKLLDPKRERLLPVAEVLEYMELIPGEVFADVGCGPGYLTLPLAQRLEAEGRVYAVDISPEMLDILRERLKQKNIINVHPVLSGETAVTLPDAKVDGIIIVNTYHEIPVDQRTDFLNEMHRIAKPGGRIYIVDWAKEEGQHGPPLSERISTQQVQAELGSTGITALSVVNVGINHYLIAGRY